MQSCDVLDSLFTKTRRAHWSRTDGSEVPDLVKTTQSVEALWVGDNLRLGGSSLSKAVPRPAAAPLAAPVGSSQTSASRSSGCQFDAFRVARAAVAELQDDLESTTRSSLASGSRVEASTSADNLDADDDVLSDLFCRPVRRPAPTEEDECSDIFEYALRVSAGPEADIMSNLSGDSADSFEELENSAFADLFHAPTR